MPRKVGTVKTEYVGPTTPVGIDAPTPAPAGAGAGGGGGTPVSAELLMKQVSTGCAFDVKILFSRGWSSLCPLVTLCDVGVCSFVHFIGRESLLAPSFS